MTLQGPPVQAEGKIKPWSRLFRTSLICNSVELNNHSGMRSRDSLYGKSSSSRSVSQRKHAVPAPSALPSGRARRQNPEAIYTYSSTLCVVLLFKKHREQCLHFQNKAQHKVLFASVCLLPSSFLVVTSRCSNLNNELQFNKNEKEPPPHRGK